MKAMGEIVNGSPTIRKRMVISQITILTQPNQRSSLQVVRNRMLRVLFNLAHYECQKLVKRVSGNRWDSQFWKVNLAECPRGFRP